MAPLQETERRDFWEICEERYQTRPTILTSRFPSPAGTNSSVTLPSPTASSTAWCTTLIASNCAASPCARPVVKNKSEAGVPKASTRTGAEKRTHAPSLPLHSIPLGKRKDGTLVCSK
jgi:hypothetical protein